MTRSITFKLVLAFLVVSATGLALASGITYWLTTRSFRELVFNQSQGRFVNEAALYYSVHGTWEGVFDYFNLRNTFPQPGFQTNQQPFGAGGGQNQNPRFDFLLADVNGTVLIPAGQYHVGEVVPRSKLAGGTAVVVDGTQVGTVLVLGGPPSLDPLETSYLQRTNQALLYAALGAALVALVLGIFLARTLTHPLRDLTLAIRAMAKGDLKQHVQVKSRDELGELARAFNQMSADLDRLNRSRQQMTADVAHDLRTPLTVIGGYVESLRDGVLKPTPERLNTIHDEVQHLQRLVEDLRILSQADAGELSLNRLPVAPLALLKRMAKSYGHLAARKKVALEVKGEEGLPEVNLDPDRMVQVLGNLIANSLRYTPEKGKITLSVSREGERLVFAVQDNGQGIPAESLPFIFDRFYRADPSRTDGSESGLGLAIARSIVEAQGGIISAESEVGNGTTMRVAFPV
jgi:two-component system, OmpR family, sensor histidine kinase BaeS